MFKCYLLQPRSGVVYGLITENKESVGMQSVRIDCNGGISPGFLPPVFESKSQLEAALFISTKDEKEVISVIKAGGYRKKQQNETIFP